MLASEATIAELHEVLCRSKFNKYISEPARLEFFDALVHSLEIIPVSERIVDCRDPKDNKFLELAVNGGASHLISGDADLLVLHPFQEIVIVTPADFLARLT